MTNSISNNHSSGTYIWKKDAGKLLFWVTCGFVILCQVIYRILTVTGLNVPAFISPDYINTVGCAVFVIWHGTITKGWKRSLVAFITLYLVGFIMEGLGVNFGLIFGPYHYVDLYGPRVFGVPFIVPIAWELFMYPAFYLASFLIPSGTKTKLEKWWQKGIYVILLATVSGIICTCYDLITDPVVCGTGPGWIWHLSSDYMTFIHGGIPLVNYTGWILTGFIGSALYYFILESTPGDRHVKSNFLIVGVPLVIYIGILSMPVTMNIVVFHSQAIWLETIMGMGFVILLVLGKYFSQKFGFFDVDPTISHS